jgi:hypothetical protein
MDDERLEHTLRDGLAERAGDVSPGEGYARAARASARRRRTLKVGLVAGAVVAVVVPVVVVAAGQDEAGRRTDVAESPAATNASAGSQTTAAEPVPATWRTEYYQGIAVSVPPEWGWGAAPSEQVGGVSILCGDGAAGWPGKGQGEGEPAHDQRPYVGRAGYMTTDVCMNPPPPTYAKVWLGSPIEVGVIEHDNGFVQETIEVSGVTVTAIDDDAQRRAAILGSAEVVEPDGRRCDPQSEPPTESPREVETGQVQSVSVCVYGDEPGWFEGLGYATQVTGDPARELAERIGAAPPASLEDCAFVPRDEDLPEWQWVVLRVVGERGVQDVVVHVAVCPPGYDAGGGLRALTADDVGLWAIDGISTYVSGGRLVEPVAGFFAPIYG